MIRIVAIGDLHISPKISNKRLTWIGKFIESEIPDQVVFIGDLCSFDSLCKYEGNETYQGKTKPVFAQDITALRDGLTKLDLEIMYDVPKHLIAGNHEDRVYSFANRNPEVFGLLQSHFETALTDYGITYSPYGKVKTFDGVGFVHIPLSTLGKPYGGGITLEQRITADVSHDLVIGHTHRANVATRPKIGANKMVKVFNLGCALPHGHIESYAQHTLTGWSWGIWLLDCEKGTIINWQFISMKELERRYG